MRTGLLNETFSKSYLRFLALPLSALMATVPVFSRCGTNDGTQTSVKSATEALPKESATEALPAGSVKATLVFPDGSEQPFDLPETELAQEIDKFLEGNGQSPGEIFRTGSTHYFIGEQEVVLSLTESGGFIGPNGLVGEILPDNSIALSGPDGTAIIEFTGNTSQEVPALFLLHALAATMGNPTYISTPNGVAFFYALVIVAVTAVVAIWVCGTVVGGYCLEKAKKVCGKTKVKSAKGNCGLAKKSGNQWQVGVICDIKCK